jgi:hypothetical protein
MRMPERCPLPAIRKATQADSAKILECLRAAFEPYRSSYTPEAFADTVLTPEVLQHRLATMCLFVAVSDSGEIVGTIGCHVVTTEPLRKAIRFYEKNGYRATGQIRDFFGMPLFEYIKNLPE